MSNADFIPRKDGDFSRWFLRKLKHTVNKVSPLRDLAWPDCDRLRTLKRAVNKVLPLRGFADSRQSRLGKPSRGNTLLIRRQAYPVNNPRIYPGVNAASPQMNAGGVTLLYICKTPKGQRLPAFAEGEERRLPPDKSGGYSQDTPTGVPQCAPVISCAVVIPRLTREPLKAPVIPRLTRNPLKNAEHLIRGLRVKPAMTNFGKGVKPAMTSLGKGREARKERNKRRQPSPSLCGEGAGGRGESELGINNYKL